MKLTEQIARRERSLDYFSLGAVLPNPDPLLKAQGIDLRVYRDLRADAHIGGCCRRRKSALKALEWGFERTGAPARLQRQLEAVFAGLDLDRLIGDCSEAVFYGYAPIEILWEKRGALIVPAELRALPQEWFTFDIQGALRFRSKEAPWAGEALPDRKFLLPRQDASYRNPYGFADLSMVYWPHLFKKGGLKFWLHFAEKYGTPWIVGKLPPGTPQNEMDDLADRLNEMVQDAVAVIPDTGSIEPLDFNGTASADLYQNLVLHCRGEISIALLGSNMGMEKDSNRATAGAGLEVADSLRDADAEIVCSAVNQLAGWICELNGWSGARPVWRLWDQNRKDVTAAARDQTLHDAGARFTPAYFQRAYGYAGDEVGAAPADAAPPAAFAEPGLPGFNPASNAEDLAQLARSAGPHTDALVARLGSWVDAAPDLPALQNALLGAYGGLDTDRLTHIMAAGFALAELKGMAGARESAR